jgi:hypothetical protein
LIADKLENNIFFMDEKVEGSERFGIINFNTYKKDLFYQPPGFSDIGCIILLVFGTVGVLTITIITLVMLRKRPAEEAIYDNIDDRISNDDDDK